MSIFLQERMARRAVTSKRVHRIVGLERRRYMRVISSDCRILFEGRIPVDDHYQWCGYGSARVDLHDELVKKGAR